MVNAISTARVNKFTMAMKNRILIYNLVWRLSYQTITLQTATKDLANVNRKFRSHLELHKLLTNFMPVL